MHRAFGHAGQGDKIRKGTSIVKRKRSFLGGKRVTPKDITVKLELPFSVRHDAMLLCDLGTPAITESLAVIDFITVDLKIKSAF